MKISILTLFPEMFSGPLSESILKIAQQKKLVEISIVNIRNFGIGKHQVVDDTPYGGGVGMLMRVDVLHQAISASKESNLSSDEEKVVLMSARGKVFKQEMAYEFSKLKHLILVCGHYEGVDARIEHFIDAEFSIGDYVLTGGEIPAMAVTDSVIRLLPGVLKSEATKNESFQTNCIEHRHYTKPQTYEGLQVPEILASGNHQKIKAWQEEDSLKETQKLRPDLLRRSLR